MRWMRWRRDESLTQGIYGDEQQGQPLPSQCTPCGEKRNAEGIEGAGGEGQDYGKGNQGNQLVQFDAAQSGFADFLQPGESIITLAHLFKRYDQSLKV